MNFHPLELIEVQKGQIRCREYRPLGRLERILLGEDSLPNPAPDNPFVGRWSSDGKPAAPSLDWLDKGPLLAMSQDQQNILVCTPTVHPPPLVDPQWRRKLGPCQVVNGIPMLEKPRTIPQNLLDRAWIGPGAKWTKQGDRWKPLGEWFLRGDGGEEWMMFQPVSQILFTMPGKVGMGIIGCSKDFDGRHTLFVYDRKSERGLILFGHKEIELLRPA